MSVSKRVSEEMDVPLG
jgi:pre-mRNA-splicing factor ATP-dependent RNA helicase DHX15/PRP43